MSSLLVLAGFVHFKDREDALVAMNKLNSALGHLVLVLVPTKLV